MEDVFFTEIPLWLICSPPSDVVHHPFKGWTCVGAFDETLWNYCSLEALCLCKSLYFFRWSRFLVAKLVAGINEQLQAFIAPARHRPKKIISTLRVSTFTGNIHYKHNFISKLFKPNLITIYINFLEEHIEGEWDKGVILVVDISYEQRTALTTIS